ncbi:MAG: ABC transporter permease [Bacteriovoracaceae bacterium]
MNFLDVFIAFVLVSLCALLSWWKGHGQEKDLLIAAVRCILQLTFLGYLLTWIFAHNQLIISLALAMVMTFNSALQSRSRVKGRYPGLLLDNLLATALSIWPMALVGSVMLGGKNWWSVENFLPFIGVLLGNSVNGISMGIDHFTQGMREKKEEVLEWLALGANKIEATNDIFRRSVKISLTPIMNSMMVFGIISIPGAMTGQILGGTSPMEAAITQMIIVLLIAVAVYLGVISGLVFARKRLFNKKGQLCL